ATRARDHLVLSLYRAKKPCHADTIAARLAEPNGPRYRRLDLAAAVLSQRPATDAGRCRLTPDQHRAAEAAWAVDREALVHRLAEARRFVDAVLASEPLRQAVACRHWREVPLGARIDGVILEGRVDLLYENPDASFAIVDFKTDAVDDRTVRARAAEYRLQG